MVAGKKKGDEYSSRFRTKGIKVEQATGGFQALSLVENNEYGLIIIVENMADMAGFEIISLIRTTHQKQKLPILFVLPGDEKLDQQKLVDVNTCLESTANFNQIMQETKSLLKLKEI